MNAIRLFVLLILFCLTAQAEDYLRDEVLVVQKAAALFAAPESSAKTNSSIAAGRLVKAAGPSENGFVPLVTKSGRAWVREDDVRSSQPGVVETVQPTRFPFGIQRITFDLGASFGSYNDLTYTEVNLGFNTYFSEYFAWRNAVFGRFMSTVDNIYGVDSSLRGIFTTLENGTGFTAFAGPGYRIASRESAPLGEAGLILRFGGLSIGGGAKTVFHSLVRRDAPNDTQFFLILAGSGDL